MTVKEGHCGHLGYTILCECHLLCVPASPAHSSISLKHSRHIIAIAYKQMSM